MAMRALQGERLERQRIGVVPGAVRPLPRPLPSSPLLQQRHAGVGSHTIGR